MTAQTKWSQGGGEHNDPLDLVCLRGQGPGEDRTGNNLDKRQRKVLKDAKNALRKAFGKPVKG